MKRILGCLLMMAAAATAQTPQELFSQGLVKERSDGQLKAAIQLYEKAAQSAGKDRALAAKALLAAAECYRKLGDVQSGRLFERVVNDFPEQKEAVATARARLEPAHVTSGIAVRQVWTGPKVDIYGSISPDGKFLSFVDWENHGALGIHDLTTGSDRLLTPAGEAENSTISKDGTLVAYSWFKPDVWRYEVRLANLTGDPKPRVLFDNPEVSETFPYDWSPDKKWIAVGVQRADHTAQIGLLSADTGKLKVLKSTDWRGPTRMFFSPDGRYVAFDMPAAEGEAQRDVYIMAVDGSREIPTVVDPNNDFVMGWPAGGTLLFASDRSGSMGLWGLPFRDGEVQGPPELLKADLGTFESSLGVSNSGALYFGRTGTAHNVQVVPVDLPAGKFTGAPLDPVKRFVGSNSTPSWSADGKFIGCVSMRDPTGVNKILAIVNVDTGKIEREIRPRMAYVGNAQISPNAETFLVHGVDLKGRRGIFLLDPGSGGVQPMALDQEPTGSGRPDQVASPDWSPDGKKVFFVRIAGNRRSRAFVEKDLATGEERELIRADNLGLIRISPDGRWLATVKSDAVSKTASVVLISLQTPAPVKELVRSDAGGSLTLPGWMPDSRAVLVRKVAPNPGGTAASIWRIPLDGEAPHKLEFDFASLHAPGPLQISPDGRYIAYLSSGQSLSYVSVVENFLPKAGGR